MEQKLKEATHEELSELVKKKSGLCEMLGIGLLFAFIFGAVVGGFIMWDEYGVDCERSKENRGAAIIALSKDVCTHNGAGTFIDTEIQKVGKLIISCEERSFVYHINIGDKK